MPALGVLMLVLTGCDPIFGVYLQQRLTPSPTASCVAAALARSKTIKEWDAPESRSGEGTIRIDTSSFALYLREFGDAEERPPTIRMALVRGDGGSPVLLFDYETLHGPTLREQQEMERVAAEIVPLVEGACGVTRIDTLTCERSGFRGRRPCGGP